MAVSNRNQLVVALTMLGTVGAAREGALDRLFQDGPPTPASTTTLGVVKQTAAVTNLTPQTVTDIATAQASITVIVNKLNSLLAAQRTSGQLAT